LIRYRERLVLDQIDSDEMRSVFHRDRLPFIIIIWIKYERPPGLV
jgi:hypothetical protein